MAAADEALGHAAHRKLVVHDEELGARLGAAAGRDGWNVYRLLVMVRDRAPERTAPRRARRGGRARQRARAALAAFRREQPFGWQEEAVQQLAAMDDRYGAPCGRATSRRRSRTRPPPAGSTPPTGWPRSTRSARSSAARGRGHASAAVLAAVDSGRAPRAATRSSCSPTPPTGPSSSTRGSASARSAQLYEFLKLPLGGPLAASAPSIIRAGWS